MAVNVRIPTTMRPLTGGAKHVELDAGPLSNVIAALEAKHPGMGERLLDDDDVRYLDGLDTKVDDGWTVSIIPAVAGG
jgi:molybdopterin synthase sulfur carrier subunit